MALQELLIVWLDGTFKGEESLPTPERFEREITSSTAHSDPIDELLCLNTADDRVTSGTIILTACTELDAYNIIKNNGHKRIYFVSSGSLGRKAIPHIVQHYHNIFSFYVFCANMEYHVEWAFPFMEHLQMFTHPTDLLVRLMRDISVYFIDFGKTFLSLNSGDIALKYFKHSQYLENKANELDRMEPNTKTNQQPFPKPPRMNFLNLLQGDQGLLRQAENMVPNQPPYNNDQMET